MKVLMINGSRREKGCTYTALTEVGKVLKEKGIDYEIFFVGQRAVNGEMEALLKEAEEKLKECDGVILGSPVYYASPTGEILAFLDRLFRTCPKELEHKPGAAVVSARRAGTSTTLDVLNKYFMITEMPIVSSSYWNMVHGNTPEEVYQDKEGLAIMHTMGENMAWLLQCIALGKTHGAPAPNTPERPRTNFIR